MLKQTFIQALCSRHHCRLFRNFVRLAHRGSRHFGVPRHPVNRSAFLFHLRSVLLGVRGTTAAEERNWRSIVFLLRLLRVACSSDGNFLKVRGATDTNFASIFRFRELFSRLFCFAALFTSQQTSAAISSLSSPSAGQ